MRVWAGRIAITCAAVLSCLTASTAKGAEFDKYAIESASVSLSSLQAGAHADVTIAFRLTENEDTPYALTRDIDVDLPPGVIGNPQTVPTCGVLQLGTEVENSECPQDSQVGTTEVTLGGDPPGTFLEPIYNMPSPGGDVVARLGFFAAAYPAVINVRLNPLDDSLSADLEGLPAAAALIGATTTLWGVPAAPSHNQQRLTPEEAFHHQSPPGGRSPGLPEAPFMSNPTSCESGRQVSISARSYQLPEVVSKKVVPFPNIAGCGKLGFAPRFSLLPTSSEAASATGVDVNVEVPQDETPNGRATSALRAAEVTLPPGLTINPAAGDGLEACSPAQVGFQTAEEAHCPDASKIGNVEIDVPALEHTLHGSIYQRTPEGKELFKLWVVTDELGVHLKLPAEIHADPATGRLRTAFDGIPALGGNPQVPFSDFRLHFFGGPRAPLSTPNRCGTYQTHYELIPWSGSSPVVGDSPMQITSGCEKGGFAPGLTAGVLDPFAGAFSPFVLDLTRADGEANPSTLEVHLPQGLLAKLGGVPLCSGQATVDGNCPSNSQVGTVAVATGIGGAPLWIPQAGKSPTAIYLAGPYKGAPYSLVITVPAEAGPFDLGTVVTRAAIYVDPTTAQVSVRSDPLPQILEGVPVSYRSIQVNVDRPNFMLNPTNCDATQIGVNVTASSGETASPVAGFQATNCANLAFRPKFSASTNGHASRTNGASLRVKIAFPHPGPQSGDQSAEANIAGVHVELPKALPARLTTLQKACTDKQFTANPAGCPAASVVGHAKAITPILNQPLEGPAYFVSHGGAAFPELVVVLQGEGITIQLNGETFINGKTNVTSSTFAQVPDAPISSFELTLPEGKYSELAAPGNNLCTQSLIMPTKITGQNGAVVTQNTPIEVEGCSSVVAIASHNVKNEAVTLKLYVPGPGKVSIDGQGLHSNAKNVLGRGTVTLSLTQRHAGRLHTRVRVAFTPTTGKARKPQVKTLKVYFRK
jgi:hypothetical protein